MPNGFPNPKELLTANLAGIKQLEATLPAGVPQIANVLSTAIQSLPDLPASPLGGGALPPSPITNFVKSLEGALPQGVPKLSQTLGTKTVIGTVVESPGEAVTGLITKIGL